MRKLIVCGVGLVAALALTVPGAFGGATPDTRRHGQVDHDRRDVPAHRAGGVVRADSGRHEGVLQLHQRRVEGPDGKRGVLRSPDHLEVLRRRLQPRQHGPADAPARRAGQGLRHRRPARHRAGSRGSRRTSTSKRCRRRSSRPGASYCGTQYKEFPWTTGWQPDYIAEGRLYGLHVKANFRGQEDRGRLPERRLRQGLSLRLPRGARQAVRRRQHGRPGGGRDDGHIGRGVRWRGSRRAVRPILAVFQLPNPTVRGRSRRPRRSASTPSRST